MHCALLGLLEVVEVQQLQKECSIPGTRNSRVCIMAKVDPFYSANPNLAPNKKVYHDDNKCTEGNNIESYYKKSGIDNRPKCNHCRALCG